MGRRRKNDDSRVRDYGVVQPIPMYRSPNIRVAAPRSVVPECISTLGDEKLPRGPKAPLMWQEARNLISINNPHKKKRRTTPLQRTAANIRERRRMNQLNVAFDSMREVLPRFPNEKKPSRIKTLRQAIKYIGLMTEILAGNGQSVWEILEERGIVATFAWELS